VETRDGSLSAQWEHMVAVTETGYEVLSLIASERKAAVQPAALAQVQAEA
jgi:methionyl aminopeptidase